MIIISEAEIEIVVQPITIEAETTTIIGVIVMKETITMITDIADHHLLAAIPRVLNIRNEALTALTMIEIDMKEGLRTIVTKSKLLLSLDLVIRQQ